MIVVVIIAVLMAINLPIFTSQLEKYRRAVDLSNARNMKSILMPDGALYTNGGKTLYFYPSKKTGEYTIPEGVTETANDAFNGTNLTKLVIADSVTRMGEYAFSNSKTLQTIVFGKCIKVISRCCYRTLPECFRYAGSGECRETKRRCAGAGDGYGPFGDSHAESNRMRDLRQSYQTEWFCMQQCRWQNHGGKYHTVWGNTTGSSGMVDEFSGTPCEICQKARNVI